MGSWSNQKPWVPYMNTKDCSQGFCSLYCPQWCYIWPPPPPFEFPDDASGPNFSPLVIAIIGILASALLLVSYYAIISKYCRNRNSSVRRENQFPVMDFEENLHQDPDNHQEPWLAPSNGLDESTIKLISIFKYKKGDGLTEGTDCSVCLSEFEEDESLKLLPKCSHAFHALCIDTWLKSHSNCPLCRANVIVIAPLPPITQANESHLPISHDPVNNVVDQEDIEIVISSDANIVSETHQQQHTDMMMMIMENRKIHSSSSETGEDESEEEQIRRRRSVSMDYICPDRLSIAEILQIHNDDDEEDDDEQTEEEEEEERYTKFPKDVGTSKQPLEEMIMNSSNNRNRTITSSPTSMKRSYSSGRFLFPKRARGRITVLPL